MKINILVGLMAITLLMLLGTTPSTEARRQETEVKTTQTAKMNMMPKGGMVGREASDGRGQSEMMGRCKMMMQMHQKMEITTKAQDAKIKDLMTTMDKTMDQAFGDQKMIALVAVVKELVAQRTNRQEMMDKMQPQMMGHMMEHMQGMQNNNKGMQSGSKKMMQQNQTAMMQCPMMQMKGMKDMPGMPH